MRDAEEREARKVDDGYQQRLDEQHDAQQLQGPLTKCPRCHGWGDLDELQSLTCPLCGGEGTVRAAVAEQYGRRYQVELARADDVSW